MNDSRERGRRTAQATGAARAAAWTRRVCAFALAAAAVGMLLVPLLVVLASLRPLGADSAAFVSTWTDGRVWARFGESLWLAGASVLLAAPFGVFFGWVLARCRVPFRRFLIVLGLFPLALPPLAHVLGWYGWLGATGRPAIVGVFALVSIPPTMILALLAFSRASQEHLDSLRLLGGWRAVAADDWRRLPPTLAAAFALGVALVLSDFAVADFLTSVGPKISTHADSIHAAYVGGRAARASALVAMNLTLAAVCLAVLVAWRRRVSYRTTGGETPGAPVFEGAGAKALGAATALLLLVLGGGPVAGLAVRSGSPETIRAAWSAAAASAGASLRLGAFAAGMVVIAAAFLVLVLRSRRWRLGAEAVALLAFLTPPLAIALGMIALFNRPLFDAVYVGEGIVVLALGVRFAFVGMLFAGEAVESVSPDAMESARLGGASGWAARWVALRAALVLPLTAAGCLAWCLAIRELDTLFLFRGAQGTLMFRLYSSVVFARPEEVAALGLLASVVVGLPFAGFALFLFRRRSS